MPYSPTKPDATPCAADAAARFAVATGQPTSAVDTLVALLDSMLCSVGYQAQNDAFALGSATTTSTSFVDVGNGSSTGFSSWTFSAPVAKVYTIDVTCSAYKSASSLGSQMWFQLLVDGVAQPNTSEMTTFFGMNLDPKKFIFSVPVALSAGSHTVKLQWKVSASMTANVDAATEGRCFRVRG